MASICMIPCRGISTTSVCHGKRNIRKILLYNKRGNRAFKQAQATDPNFDIPIDRRGVKLTGYYIGTKWIDVPEKIPELIVPSLEGFTLKPYVSYRAENVGDKNEFTAQDLFNAVYRPKIVSDYINNKLGPNNEPLEPSENEKLTREEAINNARKTGSDIFKVDRPNTPLR